jgi:hypothetical protein
MDEKIFNIKEQYNYQNNKIYAQTSHEVKKNVSRVQRGHHPFFIMVWGEGGGGSHQGGTPLHFCKKGVKLVPQCIKMMCFKDLQNIVAQPSSLVRNGSSGRTQFLSTRPRRLRSGCGRLFGPSSALRIGPQGVQISTPWTINCGLFWRTWHA